jgi:hypothetical protein
MYETYKIASGLGKLAERKGRGRQVNNNAASSHVFWRRCEVRLGIACSYMHTWILVRNVDANECPHASEHAILVRDSAERWEVVGLDRSTQGHCTGCLVRHTRKDRFDRFDRLIDQSIDRLFVVFPYATYGETCPVEVEYYFGPKHVLRTEAPFSSDPTSL